MTHGMSERMKPKWKSELNIFSGQEVELIKINKITCVFGGYEGDKRTRTLSDSSTNYT